MRIKHYLISSLLYVFALQCHAFSWQDLWQSKNQQAKELMKRNDFAAAQNTFENEDWRAIAAFRAKDYQQAANLFAKSNTADANYNLGNALAYLGKYQEALTAYDKVLANNKNHKDAEHNKKIVEKLLQKQKKQEQEQEQDKNKTNKDRSKAPEEKNNSNSKNQESQNQPKTGQNNPEQQKPSKTPAKPKNSKSSNANKSNKTQKQEDIKHENGNNKMQEQWLKLIPDDPGGLLREKFKRDYLRRRGELNQ